MKKTVVMTSVVLALALALSSCSAAIKQLGGYTAEEYNAQATQAANLQKANEGLTGERDQWKGDYESLKALKDQLDQDKKALAAELGNYRELVCPDYDWDQVTNDIRVWFLSDSNPNLVQVEKDTQVSFLVTQWLPLTVPEDTSGATGYWVLTYDAYNGIALDSAHGCVILNPKFWPDVAK